jgi:RimJ/RimL family protein N-acetyltransferase
MTTHTNALGQPIGPSLDGWQAPPRPPRTVIDGRWARLEPLDPDRHARALFDANALDADGRNWTYLPIGPFPTFAAYDEWLRRMAAGDDPLFFTLIDRDADRPVGVASYLRIDPAAGSIEVGHINFSPLAQRTRAATEAMFLMMRHAFGLGYRRYEWKCDALNAPSRAAANASASLTRVCFVRRRSTRVAAVTRRGTRSSTTSSRPSNERSVSGSRPTTSTPKGVNASVWPI